jgi:hypothetical protein
MAVSESPSRIAGWWMRQRRDSQPIRVIHHHNQLVSPLRLSRVNGHRACFSSSVAWFTDVPNTNSSVWKAPPAASPPRASTSNWSKLQVKMSIEQSICQRRRRQLCNKRKRTVRGQSEQKRREPIFRLPFNSFAFYEFVGCGGLQPSEFVSSTFQFRTDSPFCLGRPVF